MLLTLVSTVTLAGCAAAGIWPHVAGICPPNFVLTDVTFNFTGMTLAEVSTSFNFTGITEGQFGGDIASAFAVEDGLFLVQPYLNGIDTSKNSLGSPVPSPSNVWATIQGYRFSPPVEAVIIGSSSGPGWQTPTCGSEASVRFSGQSADDDWWPVDTGWLKSGGISTNVMGSPSSAAESLNFSQATLTPSSGGMATGPSDATLSFADSSVNHSTWTQIVQWTTSGLAISWLDPAQESSNYTAAWSSTVYNPWPADVKAGAAFSLVGAIFCGNVTSVANATAWAVSQLQVSGCVLDGNGNSDPPLAQSSASSASPSTTGPPSSTASSSSPPPVILTSYVSPSNGGGTPTPINPSAVPSPSTTSTVLLPQTIFQNQAARSIQRTGRWVFFVILLSCALHSNPGLGTYVASNE